MLSRVEGMAPTRSRAGVHFRGGTLDDFLAGLDGRLGVNVGANVGHCAVRRYVMGDDASERAATDDEIEQMQRARARRVRPGCDRLHVEPVRVARRARRARRAEQPREPRGARSRWRRCCTTCGRGSIEFIPRTFLTGYDDADRELVLAMARASGRPLHLNTLTLIPHAPEGWSRSLEFAGEAHDRRPRRASDVRDEPAGRALLARLHVPVRRDAGVPRHADPARAPSIGPAARSRAPGTDAQGDRRPEGPIVRVRLAGRRGRDGQPRRIRRTSSGARCSDIARGAGRGPPRRVPRPVAGRRSPRRSSCSPRRRARSVRPWSRRSSSRPLVMAGSSDGGAHLLSFCGADFTTRLSVSGPPTSCPSKRRSPASHRSPRRPTASTDRGTLEAGKAADVLLIDREASSAGDTPRYVRDFPADSGRYVVDATGYHSVIVNGETLLRDGVDTSRRPGVILRPER